MSEISTIAAQADGNRTIDATTSSAMLSVVIPTLNAAATLGATLAALSEGVGLVREIIVVDAGSSDATPEIARDAGAAAIAAPPGRGAQLAAGAAHVRGDWLLFLHADTVLEQGWAATVRNFIENPTIARLRPLPLAGEGRVRAGAADPTLPALGVSGSQPSPRPSPASGRGVGEQVAYFRLRLDDPSPAARRVERLVSWRCRAFGLPYGDQGLLISAAAYRALGGYRALPLMEDVELVRRLGRARLVELPAAAITSAERYRRDGWWRRPLRNLVCLAAYFAGVPPRLIARLYE
jgi:glycosyltransferase involved in cell wall biosynthesis